MNISGAGSAGYNSGIEANRSGKVGMGPDSILNQQDVEPGASQKMSTSAGGIEDLKNWLKYESGKKYDESFKKLGLDP